MTASGKIPLVVILGPTAVGKTAVSIKVARAVHGEIVSADSRLLYVGMDIGTAKPTFEERSSVPHHLIDVTTPDKVWSLADYQSAALKIIDEIHARGALPIMVGGSGQYIRAIIDGWQIPRVPPNLELRKALETLATTIGSKELHERLKTLDPDAAERIEPSNLRRTIRALEVIFQTGKKFSSQRKRFETNFRILKIGLLRSRKELYKRIDQRIDSMIANGFEREVRQLLSAGYSLNDSPLSAIGYRQMIQYIDGKITLDEAVMLMKRKTREFVRRQANWFKESDPSIEWFAMGEDVVDRIIARIGNFHQNK